MMVVAVPVALAHICCGGLTPIQEGAVIEWPLAFDDGLVGVTNGAKLIHPSG